MHLRVVNGLAARIHPHPLEQLGPGSSPLSPRRLLRTRCCASRGTPSQPSPADWGRGSADCTSPSSRVVRCRRDGHIVSGHGLGRTRAQLRQAPVELGRSSGATNRDRCGGESGSVVISDKQVAGATAVAGAKASHVGKGRGEAGGDAALDALA